MTGGLLIGIAGVWVLCQVFGGRGLERLGVIKVPAAAADAADNPQDRANTRESIQENYDQGKTAAPSATPAPGGLADALGGNVAGIGRPRPLV